MLLIFVDSDALALSVLTDFIKKTQASIEIESTAIMQQKKTQVKTVFNKDIIFIRNGIGFT